MRVSGKVAVIAGVGPGMGRAISLLFAQEGAKLALVARTPEIIEETKTRIVAQGGEAVAIQADLTDPRQVQGVFEQTVQVYGKLDILCSLAGGYYRHLKNLTEIEEEFFDMVLTNHIKSIFHGARAAIPYLKAGGGGVILAIGAGYKTRRDGNIAYGTAKEGVIGFTRNLARELHPHNIRVNCICPGLIRIPLQEGPIRVPDMNLARRGQPEDIAYAVLYLASDEARWVTGQTLVVDGGDEVLVGQSYPVS